jgi:hypothetical protein
VVEPEIAAATWASVLVDEVPRESHDPDALEVDVESARCLVDGEHDPTRSVPDVRIGVARHVEVTGDHARHDPVADREATPTAGLELDLAELAVGSPEPASEAVEHPAGVVAPVHHRVRFASLVRVPPVPQHPHVEVDVRVRHVEVASIGEHCEGLVRSTVA